MNSVTARRNTSGSTPDHPIRIGLAIPLQGPGGMFGPSCEAVAELCRRQANAQGVLGRPIEFEVIDAGRSPQAVARSVRGLIDNGQIDALTGWHISSIREQVAPVTQGRIPYVYTSLYEGGENRPGVLCSGETPSRQVGPALAWLRDELGLHRWHIVGSDYVWPTRSARAARQFARTLGLEILSTSFPMFGCEDFQAQLDVIERGPPADGVLMFLVGQDAVQFNREFTHRGLDDELVRLAPLMEENMLLASGAGSTRGLYAAAGYFSSLPTANALDLAGDYSAAFGPGAPALNNQAESCYEGIRLLSTLFETAGETSLNRVMAVAEGVGYDGPRGTMELRDGHLDQTIYLAKAEDLVFDVLAAL